MNIAMLLDLAADGFGARVAVGGRDGGITFDDLRRRAMAVASRTTQMPAQTLALLAPNSALVPVALFGAAWAGMTYAPVNYRLPEHTQLELLRRLEPAVVVDGSWLDLPAATTGYPDLPDRPAVLLFTSGSSAEPKAAVLEHDNLLAYQFNTLEFGAADDDEAFLVSSPPFHIAGVSAVLSSTYTGRRLVPLPQFDAEGWITTARSEHATHAFLVPTMLARIVTLMDADPGARVPSLRHLVYGGARLPTPVLERALTLLPHTDFVNAYGLTETASTLTVLGPDDHRAAFASNDPAIRARLTSAGRAVPGIEIRVVGDDGEAVPPGVSGEIHARGAQVSGEYLGVGSVRDAEGWMPTRDRGRLDADGYLYVEGRGDEIIIRGGENLATAEIEDALLRHPDVTAAAVVGVPDPEWGERVAAMVTLGDAARVSADELRDYVRADLGSFKTPDVLAIRPELPHTATGKVLRRQVRAELSE